MMDGLESAELKLKRAETHIKAIETSGTGDTHATSARIVPHPNSESTVDLSGDLPDPNISLLAGEAIYQIKSSLDHLAFDLVKRNASNIQLPAKWERRCEFPLLLDVPMTGNPAVPFSLPLRYNYFARTLPGISEGAFGFIEAVQPYHRRNTGNVLRIIEQLSNIDKHRHLHIINPQAYYRAQLISPAGNHLSVRRVEHGAKLEPAFPPEMIEQDGAVYVEDFMHPFVSFDESVLETPTARLPIYHLLQLCVNEIRTVIFPAFEILLKGN
jgi:hypothetical protein